MTRSTTLYIALATLLLGSGASGLLVVKPALEQQDKLKTQKAAASPVAGKGGTAPVI